jgi:hypothetical protein
MLPLQIHPTVNLLTIASEICLMILECLFIQQNPINLALPFFVKEKLSQPYRKHEATLGLLRTASSFTMKVATYTLAATHSRSSVPTVVCYPFTGPLKRRDETNLEVVYHFLHGISLNKRRLLKHLNFGICFENGKKAMELLRKCPSLTHLEVVLSEYSYMGRALGDPRMFLHLSGIDKLREIRGCKEESTVSWHELQHTQTGACSSFGAPT